MSIQEIIKSEFLEGKKNKYQKILNKASSEAKEKANLLGSNIVKKTSLFSASLSNKISKGIEKANSYADKFKGRVDELISLKEDAGISYFLLCYSEKKDLFKISHELYISSYDPIEELTNFVKIFELNCSSSESFGAYQHVGVYLGGGEVIHIRRDKDPGFVKGSFEDFLKGGKDKIYGFNFSRQSSLVFFGSNLNPGHLVFNIGSRFQEFVNSIPLGGEAIVKKIIS
ncbi:14948_t:CDS:2 [Funneliformis geosporum]|uniref:14948_t:CDS:1 n=1 Tax=Funneliformis geosporum TaxID=1117311 RepID=A0A9W4SPL2_9GLOM|nr:14948_t:CDS:2 [Funneliformis geosporum]